MKGSVAITQIARRFASSIMLCGLLALSGCASFYLDNATRDIPASAYKKPEAPRPVQLVFDFQTKGVSNAAATKFLKEDVTRQIQASGLFREVKESPVEGGAILNVVVNNVPLSDDAFSKGFVTGLTFGLAGSQVSDGYVCTLKYLPRPDSPPIVKSSRHAIHTVLGAKEGPAQGTKMDNVEVAVKTMSHQIVSNALDALSRDPAFK